MGTLNTILSNNPDPVPAVRAPVSTAAPEPPPAQSPLAWPDPAPCVGCGCPAFWLDVYGGGPHCRGCSVPSSPSLAAHQVWVIGEPGSFRWVSDPRREKSDGREVTWTIPTIPPTFVTAAGDAGDVHRRVHNKWGCYNPPLSCGPVGDLGLDDWLERLPVWAINPQGS
jgi:hypothetical protein